MTPGDSYTPEMAPSLSYEIEQQPFDQDAILNHNSECIFPALPPSFTSLLTNCCSTAEQGRFLALNIHRDILQLNS